MNSNSPYDMKTIITTILDENIFYEIMQDFAKNIVVGFKKFKKQCCRFW